MQIKKSLGKKVFISREYKIFSLCATLAICFAYILFCFIAYQNHQKTYNQKHLSISHSIANGYEVFLDNIFRQAEFIGHKIKTGQSNNMSLTVKHLLKRNFSMGIDLDTTLLSSWVEFNWVESKKIDENEIERKNAWKIHFKPLHSESLDIKDSYIPISFGITDKNGNFAGKLASKINMFELTEYLGHILENKQIHILILDKENNIIAQYPSISYSVPKDLFKNYRFNNQAENFLTKYEFDNIIYSTYKKLGSYPFTIVVGENKAAIFKPLFNTLISYFLVLVIVLIAFLTILSKFYNQIITPVISLSGFAGKILESSDDKIKYQPEKHPFIEIKNLSDALMKIESYQKEICDSNKSLNEKTKELELTKQNLEEDLKKLANAYVLIDQLSKKTDTHNTSSANQCLRNCLDMLYPEIYSRQLKIKESLQDDMELEISCDQLTKIISTLLSKSFMFSKKNSDIEIKTGSTVLEGTSYLCFSIEDNGMGDEEWRDKNFDSSKMDETNTLIKNNGGILRFINKKDGVKYCLLLPQKQQNANSGNISYLFGNPQLTKE